MDYTNARDKRNIRKLYLNNSKSKIITNMSTGIYFKSKISFKF